MLERKKLESNLWWCSGQKERFGVLLQILGKMFSSAPNQVVKDMLVYLLCVTHTSKWPHRSRAGGICTSHTMVSTNARRERLSHCIHSTPVDLFEGSGQCSVQEVSIAWSVDHPSNKETRQRWSQRWTPLAWNRIGSSYPRCSAGKGHNQPKIESKMIHVPPLVEKPLQISWEFHWTVHQFWILIQRQR